MSRVLQGGRGSVELMARRIRVALAWVAVSAAAVVTALPARAADGCGFSVAFNRPDEQGTKSVPVYRGRVDSRAGNSAPLAFVSDLKVNTDGTRISYKVDDPRAEHGAINDIRNAIHWGFTIADFERIRSANWEPVEQTWRVLSAAIIEKDTKRHRTGKPCVGADGYLVSKTADVSVAGGLAREGDCDQSKWIDALTIPTLVLPIESQFQTENARTRNWVVVMTLDEHRLAFGIVGDTGPRDEIGEASVEMNRMLNGLPAGAVPQNREDAEQHFQAPRSLVLVFPGEENRLPYPITPQRVMDQVKARFTTWGGEARLLECAAEIPAARP
jgi:hypothetical protein